MILHHLDNYTDIIAYIGLVTFPGSRWLQPASNNSFLLKMRGLKPAATESIITVILCLPQSVWAKTGIRNVVHFISYLRCADKTGIRSKLQKLISYCHFERSTDSAYRKGQAEKSQRGINILTLAYKYLKLQ